MKDATDEGCKDAHLSIEGIVLASGLSCRTWQPAAPVKWDGTLAINLRRGQTSVVRPA